MGGAGRLPFLKLCSTDYFYLYAFEHRHRAEVSTQIMSAVLTHLQVSSSSQQFQGPPPILSIQHLLGYPRLRLSIFHFYTLPALLSSEIYSTQLPRFQIIFISKSHLKIHAC